MGHFFFLIFIYLAASGLSCGVQALSLRLIDSPVVALRLQSTGSIVVALWLSYSGVCGMFPDQGLNLRVLQADSLPVSQQGSPHFMHSRMQCASLFKTICKESLNQLQMNG